MRRRWFYTGICLAILLGLYLKWFVETPPANFPAAVSSILITLLFAVLGIRFIPLWIKVWSGSGEGAAAVDEQPRLIFLKIFFSLIATRIAVIAFAYILYALSGGGEGFYSGTRFIWTSGDGTHYLDIAERWYQSQGSIHEVVRLVFLPFYPILVRLLAFITRNYFVSAMLISNLSFSLAGMMLYKLARLDMDHGDALRTVKYLVLLPSAFMFSAPMSDALFLLLSLLCVYSARQKKYLVACLFGGLASFTRSLGLTLLAPVCFELIADIIREVKAEKRCAYYLKYLPALLIIPMGFGAYLYINYLVSGNPLQYAFYQRTHWGQELGYFWNTAAYQLQYALSYIKQGKITMLLGLWTPNLLFLFGSAVVMILAVKRLRASYTAYFIGYFIVGMGATWLLSGPRYLAALFPLSFALSSLAKKRSADTVLTVLFALGTVAYMIAYVGRWQVY